MYRSSHDRLRNHGYLYTYVYIYIYIVCIVTIYIYMWSKSNLLQWNPFSTDEIRAKQTFNAATIRGLLQIPNLCCSSQKKHTYMSLGQNTQNVFLSIWFPDCFPTPMPSSWRSSRVKSFPKLKSPKLQWKFQINTTETIQSHQTHAIQFSNLSRDSAKFNGFSWNPSKNHRKRQSTKN